MNFNILLTKYRSLTIFGLVVVLFLLSLNFIFPQISKIQKSYSTMDEQTDRLEKQKGKLAQLKSLNEYELSKKAEISLKAVPQEQSALSLIYTVSRLAQEKSLIVKSLSVSNSATATQINPDEKPSDNSVVKLNLTVDGPVEILKDFLTSINKTFPIISVNTISTTSEGDILTTTMSLSSFYQPLPENIGKIDTPLPQFSQDQENVIIGLGKFTSVSEALPSGQVNPEGRVNPFTL